MIRTSQIIVLTVLLALGACSGSGTVDKTGPGDNPGPGQATGVRTGRGAARAVASGGSADFPRLSSVSLSNENFYANVDLTAQAEVVPPVPEGLTIEYRWYVSNRLVADASGATLKSGNFRKQQWIICEARASAGEKVSDWTKSNWVRAADSPPQIEPVAVDSFTIPGRFSYRIMASDADGDELTYELLSPLDVGIELDRKTGLLSWEIDQALVEKLGESVEISLSVSDNDAPPTTGSITLGFQKRTEKKSP